MKTGVRGSADYRRLPVDRLCQVRLLHRNGLDAARRMAAPRNAHDPHSMALDTASHEAVSITIVSSRLISASPSCFFVTVLITDSLVQAMFRFN